MAIAHIARSRGVSTSTEVGMVGGGYFQTEMRRIDLEVTQLEQALELLWRTAVSESDIDASTSWWQQPAPTSWNEAQRAFWKSSWLPFIETWRDFYTSYTTGWKSTRFPIVQSRIDQMEDFHDKFKQVWKLAHDVFPGDTIANLPEPSERKKYTSIFEDIAEAIKGGIKWILLAIAGVAVIYLIVHLKGGNPMLIPARARVRR